METTGRKRRRVRDASDSWSNYPCRTFITRVYNRASATYEQHHIAPTITVKGKELYVNGVRIPPTVTRFCRQQIYWRYQHSAAFSYGYLNFHRDGYSFHGMYATGASPSTATLVAIQGVVAPSTYSTTISKNPSYDPKAKRCSVEETDESFTSGLEVEIGYKWDHSGGLPTQIFKVGGKDLKDELRMDSANHFIIDEDPETDMYADTNPRFPVAGEFTMAPDSKSFTGSITLKRGGKNVANYCWSGKSTSSSAHEIPHISKLLALPEPVELAAAGSEPLSILDLFTLCHAPPSIQEDSQNMMMEVMKYVVGEQHPDWLENFLGEKKPILAPEFQQIAELPKSQAFYTNFVTPYVGIGLYQTKGKGIPHISLTGGRTMLYYFQNGLAKEPGYTEQTNALYLQAFLVDKPRLKDYLDNQSKRKSSGSGEYYWAEQLHAAVLNHDSINNLVSAAIHNQGDVHQQLRDYSTVLNLLQPSGALAQDAYEKLLVAIFGTLTETMNPKNLKDKIAPWVKDFIQEWVNKFDKGEAPTVDKKALQAWETAQTLKEAAHIFGDLSELADQITELIVTERANNIYERSNGVGTKIANKYEATATKGLDPEKEEDAKKITRIKTSSRVLKRAVVAAAHVGALMTTIQAFMHWNEIPTEQKVSLIAETVELGLELLIDLPEMINDAVGIFKAARDLLYKSDNLKRLGTAFGRMATRVGKWVETIAESIKGFVPEGATKFAIEAGKFLKGIFDLLPRVLSIVAPIVSLIVVIDNVIALHTEPDLPFQDKILLTLQTLAGIMETECLIVGIFIEEVLCFAGPLAIVGVVLAIVTFIVDMIFKPDPPPSPAQKFYNDTLKDHVAKLTRPPHDFDPEGKVPPPKKKGGSK